MREARGKIKLLREDVTARRPLRLPGRFSLVDAIEGCEVAPALAKYCRRPPGQGDQPLLLFLFMSFGLRRTTFTMLSSVWRISTG